MRLSRKQKMMLHTIPAGLHIEDAQRRIIQRNVGGFHSAADPTCAREGFIAVMAFYERCASGRLDGFTAGYWADQDARANPCDGLRHRARHLAGEIGWSAASLDSFVAGKRMSNGACPSIEAAPAYWLHRVIEALKAIGKRRR